MTQTMTEENKNREALWQRIAAFPIDDPGAQLPFSRKLAREQGWTPEFTLGSIEEYKRFIFLCCISPHGASPSKVVDEVWHLHLTYTRNYWKDFCGATLGYDIHHEPSTGGTDEREKHEDWRTDTLELYREAFHTDPPEAFWDDSHVPKVRRTSQWHKIFQVLVFIAFTLTGCTEDTSSGYVTVAVIIVAFIGMISFKAQERYDQEEKRQKGDGSGSGCGSSDGCSGGDSGCGSGCGGCGGGGD